MAFPLSSAIISHKLSFNASIRSLRFRPPHFILCINRIDPQKLGRSSRLHCMSNKNLARELEDRHSTLTNSYMSTDGYKKKLQNLIGVILVVVQISSPISLDGWAFWPISPANAVLYSPDTKVPRTGELALRRAIPANPNMKAMQDSLEEILYLLRIPQRKPYGTMEGNVKKALKIATDENDSILASIPTDLREKGSTLHVSLIDGKEKENIILLF
ncbi:peptidyl-prolyl cis-trans isomerase CYP37, chloroplastic [Argentina anserina]|uniref:peptidyl-prolyl cis-trans isomerase CYP37, chloroplastic n=1 Tax=Argentina anserina TaxID=57926 RepID=UPI0021762B75|nr:peptidyl-prolyl cis-trans isomerase CYP37, chloroplastic [Potentilla anserina]